MTKVIGILGGMGPIATADLFKNIIENTPSKSDQEHLRIIIDNNPKIPSRIKAILEGTESPLPEMQKSAKTLEMAGADFIIIPCHTAHYWLNQLQQTVNIPIYSLIDAACFYIKDNYNNESDKILILATEATVKLKLYENTLNALGCNLMVPTYNEQKIVSSAIIEVKAGYIATNTYIEQLNIIINRYMAKGLLAVFGGCTEISLLLPYLENQIKKIDPTLILAETAIALAK